MKVALHTHTISKVWDYSIFFSDIHITSKTLCIAKLKFITDFISSILFRCKWYWYRRIVHPITKKMCCWTWQDKYELEGKNYFLLYPNWYPYPGSCSIQSSESAVPKIIMNFSWTQTGTCFSELSKIWWLLDNYKWYPYLTEPIRIC